MTDRARYAQAHLGGVVAGFIAGVGLSCLVAVAIMRPGADVKPASYVGPQQVDATSATMATAPLPAGVPLLCSIVPLGGADEYPLTTTGWNGPTIAPPIRRER